MITDWIGPHSVLLPSLITLFTEGDQIPFLDFPLSFNITSCRESPAWTTHTLHAVKLIIMWSLSLHYINSLCYLWYNFWNFNFENCLQVKQWPQVVILSSSCQISTETLMPLFGKIPPLELNNFETAQTERANRCISFQ